MRVDDRDVREISCVMVKVIFSRHHQVITKQLIFLIALIANVSLVFWKKNSCWREAILSHNHTTVHWLVRKQFEFYESKATCFTPMLASNADEKKDDTEREKTKSNHTREIDSPHSARRIATAFFRIFHTMLGFKDLRTAPINCKPRKICMTNLICFHKPVEPSPYILIERFSSCIIFPAASFHVLLRVKYS